MHENPVEQILRERRPSSEEVGDGKFFSYLLGDKPELHFLEIKKNDGSRLNVTYSGLHWFYYDATDNFIELDFDSIAIRINGRGLTGKLYTGLQQKRIAWIKEATSEMEDHKDQEIYIETIIITPTDTDSE